MIILRQHNFSLISRGIRFIEELRTIEPLPISFEEYATLLYPAPITPKNLNIIKNGTDETNRISDILNSFYKSPKASDILTRVGRAYTESQYKVRTFVFNKDWKKDSEFRKAIQFSYEKIQKLPKRYLTKLLGIGGCGIAFDYPIGNRIEKICFLPLNKNEIKFYTYLINHPTSVFPKIYSIEPDQVIMEKLITKSENLEKWRGYLKEFLLLDPKEIIMPVKKPNWDKINSLPENHEFRLWINKVWNELYKITGKHSLGDLGRSNIGERIGTGEIVYFDPIGGRELGG